MSKSRHYNYETILGWIVEYKKSHDGNSPTIRDIKQGCGISSTSVVNYVLATLEREGRIVLSDKGHARAISVVGGQWSLS